MVHQNIAQPVPFYESSTVQHWDKHRCQGLIVDAPYFRKDRPFAFVIERDAEVAASIVWKYVSEDGTEYSMPVTGFTIFTADGKDYIYQNGEDFSITGVPCGRYRIKLEDGVRTYWSEWFVLMDCPTTMIRFDWRDSCAKAGMPWDLAGNRGTFHFWMDTEIGPAVTVSDEEVEDDGTRERVISLRTVSTSTVADVLPEHLVRCFHAMKHHGDVSITDQYDGQRTIVRVGQVSAAPVSRGCRQSVSVSLTLLGEWRGDCCGQTEAGCPEPCAVADGIYGIHTPYVIGQTYLYPGGLIATYWSLDQEEEFVNEEGFGSFVPCGRVAMTTDPLYPWMRWNGSAWVALLTIDSITPDGGCANITLTATLPDGYTGQVQASWDGSTDWINIGDAYSVDELAAGVAIALSEGQAYFRIQLIGDECIAGYSVSVPVGCTCATLDVDGFEYVFGEDGLHVAYSFTDNIGAGWVTGGGRYRINGGAWITYSPVSGVPFENPEVLVDGDVIEFQLFNSLQPGCPPHSYQLTVVE